MMEVQEAPLVGETRVRPSFGVVVLTQGQRPEDLARAISSLQGQRGVDLDIVVVGNGWEPVGLPAGVRALGLPENRGIPAGRNAGVPLVSGDYLFFLDDDASLPDDGTLLAMARRFEEKPRLGLIQPRVVDPEGRPAPRRWTPRILVFDPGKSSPAMSVWEGAVAIRREAFEYAQRLARPLLVRARRHRTRLAGLGRRLAGALRRPDPGPPPRHRTHPARGVLPLPGP